jgi:phage terminase large subunit
MRVKKTKALEKLRNLNQRIRIVRGGSSAGKTICILLILIDYAIRNNGLSISVVTGTVPALRRGAYKDFIQIIKGLNRYKESQHNKSLMKYTFTNGSYIEFFSTDDSSKLRGARRDLLFINESNTISGFDAYQELAIRTSGAIWLDYNPTSLFWVDKELIGQPDTDFITLTYKDNDSLPESIIKELLKARQKAKTSTYWKNWCRVYLDGEVGSLEGVCIPDWKQIDTVPQESRLLAHGMDFGYTDPTSIISLYKYNDAYIFDEVFYKSNTVLRDVSLFLRQNNITENIIADQAEPKSIETLRRDGHNIYPCTKGRDSVNFGINLINQNEIYITSRSKNLKRELQGYIWATDKDGNTLPKPTGEHPDCIDAARYVLTDTISNPNKGEYHIY